MTGQVHSPCWHPSLPGRGPVAGTPARNLLQIWRAATAPATTPLCSPLPHPPEPSLPRRSKRQPRYAMLSCLHALVGYSRVWNRLSVLTSHAEVVLTEGSRLECTTRLITEQQGTSSNVRAVKQHFACETLQPLCQPPLCRGFCTQKIAYLVSACVTLCQHVCVGEVAHRPGVMFSCATTSRCRTSARQLNCDEKVTIYSCRPCQ